MYSPNGKCFLILSGSLGFLPLPVVHARQTVKLRAESVALAAAAAAAARFPSAAATATNQIARTYVRTYVRTDRNSRTVSQPLSLSCWPKQPD